MIAYFEGDLFQSPAKVLVNPVNTAGVMGKGLALEFKRRYPGMFQVYQTLCEKKQLDIGQLWIYKTPEKWILNFPTKKHWRQKSEVEYIVAGLERFVATYQEESIDSIAFPQLGCGSGQLDWETQVQPLMEKYLGALPITIHIHVMN
jgi:O-acetyl-ADP-ribose deacetylase (regulator of RNase III)